MNEETPTYRSNSQCSTFCVHCSIPLTTTFGTNAEDDDNTTKLLMMTLSSILKLSYLNPFSSAKIEEELQLMSICSRCSGSLTQLNQFYNDFMALGQLDSYLTKKLAQLDEIINCHQQKSINCDLILKDGFIRGRGNSNDIGPPFIFNGRIPRIILTPVAPETSQYKNKYEESINIRSSSDDECQQFSPEVIMDTDSDDDFELPQDKTNSSKNIVDMGRGENSSKSKRQQKQLDSSTLLIKSTKVTPRILNKSKERNTSSPTKKATMKPSEISNDDISNDCGDDETTSPNKPKRKSKTSVCGDRAIPQQDYLAIRNKFENPCWYCKEHFSSSEECYEHTRTTHFIKCTDKFSSSVCKRCCRICTDQVMTRHLKWCDTISPGVILPKRFQCDQCSKFFPVKGHLKKHMNIVHSDNPILLCNLCPFKSKSVGNLRSHMLYQHTPGTLKCELCDLYMKNKRYLNTHMLTKHPTPETQAARDKYLERLAIKASKERAKRVERGPLTTICGDCQIDFFTRAAFCRHRRSAHGDKMGREFVCDQCGNEFIDVARLRSHISKVHTDERPYVCHTCGNSYKSTDGLRAHVYAHTKEGRLKLNAGERKRKQRKKLLNRLLLEKAQGEGANFVEIGQEYSSSNPNGNL